MKTTWIGRFRGMYIHGPHVRYLTLAISSLVLIDVILVIILILWFRGFFG